MVSSTPYDRRVKKCTSVIRITTLTGAAESLLIYFVHARETVCLVLVQTFSHNRSIQTHYYKTLYKIGIGNNLKTCAARLKLLYYQEIVLFYSHDNKTDNRVKPDDHTNNILFLFFFYCVLQINILSSEEVPEAL